MMLYHGSNMPVEHPALAFCRDNTDFGKGFYTTAFQEQARKWAERFRQRSGRGVVSHYFLDEASLARFSVKIFDAYSEDWLDFIAASRSGNSPGGYDVVTGGVANDKVFDCIELFLEGLIDKYEAIKRLRHERPNNQYCFKSQTAIDACLHFVTLEEIT